MMDDVHLDDHASATPDPRDPDTAPSPDRDDVPRAPSDPDAAPDVDPSEPMNPA